MKHLFFVFIIIFHSWHNQIIEAENKILSIFDFANTQTVEIPQTDVSCIKKIKNVLLLPFAVLSARKNPYNEELKKNVICYSSQCPETCLFFDTVCLQSEYCFMPCLSAHNIMALIKLDNNPPSREGKYLFESCYKPKEKEPKMIPCEFGCKLCCCPCFFSCAIVYNFLILPPLCGYYAYEKCCFPKKISPQQERTITQQPPS